MSGWEEVVCYRAEDSIRELVRSRGLGDMCKRQVCVCVCVRACVCVCVDGTGCACGWVQVETGEIVWRYASRGSYTHLPLPTMYSV